MPIKITCACGTNLTVRDENLAKKLACPRCGAAVSVPQAAIKHTEVAVPSLPPDPAETGIVTSPAVPPLPQEAQLSEIEEVADVDVELPDRPLKKSKGRRRGLARVNLGLGFHYFIPCLYLVGAGAGYMALILNMGESLYGFERNAAPAHFFYLASSLFLLLTALAAMAPALLCLLGSPDKAGGGPIAISLGLTVGSLLPALLLPLLDQYQWLFFALALGVLFAAWCFWMAFLKQLCKNLRQPQLAEEVRRTIIRGIRTLVISVVVVLGLGLLTVTTIRYPFLVWFVTPSVFAAAITIVFRLGGGFDSFLNFFGIPLGMSFTLDYINFIGGIRMVILRRI